MSHVLRILLPLVLLIPACKDETVSGYAAPGAVYVLAELDGAPFPARATLTLPEAGHVAGEGPCNSYAARQTLPLPWFGLKAMSVTERGCPELAAEGMFFDALQSMTLAEVSGQVMILSNDAGREMVFRAE